VYPKQPTKKPGQPPGFLISDNHSFPFHIMFNSIRDPHCTFRSSAHRIKKLLHLSVAGIVLALCSCEEGHSTPPPAPVTDTTPVGDGLKVIGFAMLGAAVVIVLGRLAR
jgi:hypothetical protein